MLSALASSGAGTAVDDVAAQLTAAGAEVVFPVSDQHYGHREGRFRDRFGHLWIVTTITERLSAGEIERRGRQSAT